MRLVTLDMRDLSPRLKESLSRLTLRSGQMRVLLADRATTAVATTAMDERGLLGWATTEDDGLVGVFVAPRFRRQGIGSELVAAARAVLAKRWPGVKLQALTKRGSPGDAFWRAMAVRWSGDQPSDNESRGSRRVGFAAGDR